MIFEQFIALPKPSKNWFAVILLTVFGCAPSGSDTSSGKKPRQASDSGDVNYDNSKTSVMIPAGTNSSGTATGGAGSGGVSSPYPDGSGFPSGSSGSSSGGGLPAANGLITQFLGKLLGSKLGNGMCQVVETESLNAANSTRGNTYLSATSSGTGLALTGAEIFPGDIMIWEGGTNHNNYPANPGDPIQPKIRGYMLFKAVAEGHVSIVKQVISPVELVIYHQNFNGQLILQTHTVRLDAITSGRITFHRPVPR